MAPAADEFMITLDGPVDPIIGRLIDDRYRVERAIGVGGMGIVYEARHVALEKPLAVKVLRPDLAHDDVSVERFRREALAASSVGNEHILDIVDFGTIDTGESYIVMEFLDGISLSDLLARESPLAIERVVHIGAQLAEGIGAAHLEGIVHRDVKPDNVMLVATPEDPEFVKVLDFGIAYVGDAVSKLTKTGEIFGSPAYMSPEQCRGEAIDARSDVYAIGIVLYELLAGVRPILGSSFYELLAGHHSTIPEPLRAHRPEVSIELEGVVSRCLEKLAIDRYADATLVAAELRRIEAGLAPKRAFDRTMRDAGVRRRRFGAASALLGLALFGYATYLALHPPRGGWFASVADSAPALEESEESLADVPIRLESVPEGAEVFVNDGLVGITPCHAPRPRAGERFELVFRKAGYENRVVSVSSATIGRLLRYTLVPIPPRVAPRVAEAVVAPSPPLVVAPPAPPPRRRRDDQVREVVDPWD